ncbi:LLM class flavin-dependent oxidoreductase [Dietzia sp. PP-33]|jgi:alkanesulfonate monooxygenase SsuD/methylene tetrahydromethanopterin reductase-like flavin-dependent oxidoreductase (luciferase family)|uniref:LLM class flavin-dependent oxidoreductase n=1 Tax=Dietzia sp. PP-33 TaxID=2957500 RepID=UPI0029BDD417|nr:LLM class flavin-dependent oxidoreductase [Dietzia sp. PP-33]MDX2357695.1 LLM class flavin-dependent oxidoreductase [Dietzia sp. PP-33]
MAYVVTRFDFRAPGADAAERRDRYRAALEMARYAEETGQDAVNLSEHHGSEDGYLPSPLIAASAVAAVTERIQIAVWALVAPLYDPVRLAEDIAVLDHVASGRVSFTFGLGYRPVEYAMHSREWRGRGMRFERQLEAMLSAWAGEPVGEDPADGSSRASVTPRPFSDPYPLVFLGGGGAAARRAGRLGMHFQPQLDDPTLTELYRAECRAHGHEPGLVVAPVPGPAAVFCAWDPDEFWDRYGRYLLADAEAYRAWQMGPGRSSFVHSDARSVEQLRAEGVYVVATPEELVRRVRAGELGLIAGHPLCGGMPVEAGWESLRLLGERVLPQIR